MIKPNESLEHNSEREINSINNDGRWKSKTISSSVKKDWLAVGFVNLAMRLKRENMAEDDIWRALMKIKQAGKCYVSKGEIFAVLYKIGQELNLTVNFQIWIPDNDEDSIRLGIQLYAALLFCPDHSDEAKRISLFFEPLIINETLATVLSATFNNLEQSNNGIQDYTPINLWYNHLYKSLDSRFNFSLNSSVIALSSLEQLNQLQKLDPPYLARYGRPFNSADMINKLGSPGQIKFQVLRFHLHNFVLKLHRCRVESIDASTPPG